jgi:hypothetical protein
MNTGPEPDLKRLEASRNSVQTFMLKKKRFGTILFWAAGTCEAIFFISMIIFMDFNARLYWFLLAGILLVYCPLIIFVWRNAIMIDHLFYRLVNELKYGNDDNPANND